MRTHNPDRLAALIATDQDARAWESFWTDLLHEYERVTSSWDEVTFPAPPRCATCGTAIAGGIEVDGQLRCIDCVATKGNER